MICIYYVCVYYACAMYILCMCYASSIYVYSMCIVRSHFISRFALCSELCVQNSCVQPAAMSLTPSTIRIGPNKHGYEYTYVGNGIYKCRRGSEWCGINEVLWLMKEHDVNPPFDHDDVWYAFDAPQDAIPTSVPHNKVIFMSTGPDANLKGSHTWILTKSNDSKGQFKTTVIQE